MKLKTRIIVGFGMSILVPLLLFSATLYGLGHTKFAQQTKDSSEVVYDISVGESTHSQTQVRIIAKDLLFTATVILVFTALSIGLWIYRSIATPLVKLKKATQNIKEGNLDFVLEVDGDDEFSELCRDFVPDECLSRRSETIELPEYQSLHNSDFHTFLRPHQSSLLSVARHRLQSQTIREVIHEVAPPNLLLREVHSVGLMLIFHPGIHRKSTSYVP